MPPSARKPEPEPELPDESLTVPDVTPRWGAHAAAGGSYDVSLYLVQRRIENLFRMDRSVQTAEAWIADTHQDVVRLVRFGRQPGGLSFVEAVIGAARLS